MRKSDWHCVFYGVESWIGVLDWSHGVEYWSGFLEWNFDVNCWRERETFILVVKLVSFETDDIEKHVTNALPI